MFQNYHPGSSSQGGAGRAGSIYLKKEVNQAITDYTNKCRVCLEPGIIPIFGAASGIGEAVSMITSVDVTDNKLLPRFLCAKCHSLLQGAMKLRKMAQQTDQILKQIIVPETETDNYFEVEFTYEPKQNIPIQHDAPKNTIKVEQNTNQVKDVISFQCDICKKEYKKIYFAKHMAVHGIVVCTYCKKSIHKLKYRRHLKEEHKVKNLYKYVCETCGKELSDQTGYQLHKLTHTNEFPYKCELCPYRGRNSGLLNNHKKTHNKEYKYQCPECPTICYLTNNSLQRHIQSRHREKEYKCDTCNKAFYTQLKLTAHQQVDHLGIRNHICNICGKDFGYRNRMMGHQRKVHKRKKMKIGGVPSYLGVEGANEQKEME